MGLALRGRGGTVRIQWVSSKIRVAMPPVIGNLKVKCSAGDAHFLCSSLGGGLGPPSPSTFQQTLDCCRNGYFSSVSLRHHFSICQNCSNTLGILPNQRHLLILGRPYFVLYNHNEMEIQDSQRDQPKVFAVPLCLTKCGPSGTRKTPALPLL